MTYVPHGGPLWIRVLLVSALLLLIAGMPFYTPSPWDGTVGAWVLTLSFGGFGVAGIVYGLYLLRVSPERDDWPGGPGAKTR